MYSNPTIQENAEELFVGAELNDHRRVHSVLATGFDVNQAYSALGPVFLTNAKQFSDHYLFKNVKNMSPIDKVSLYLKDPKKKLW